MFSAYRWWVLGALALTFLVEQFLEYLNRRQLEAHGLEIPAGFEGALDAGLLAKSRAYTLAKMKFAAWVSTLQTLGLMVFFFLGPWDAYHNWVLSFHLPFILQGWVYFLGLAVGASVLSLPIDWARTFGLEKRFGFTTATPGLWATDAAKSLAVSSVLLSLLALSGLWLVATFPHAWWVWVWSFFLAFSLFLMVISPYVLEPLFNKFKPVDNPEWVDAIQALMRRAGIRVSRVFESDASRRSRHTNAYFTGIGPVKRIVLFDTLLQKNTLPELLAVLAHEAGHWKKKHVLKRLVVFEGTALVVFYLAQAALQQPWISQIFALSQSSFAADVTGLLLIGSILSFWAGPAGAWFSRKHEREADAYAAELTRDPLSLAGALIKLSCDNLSNLHPHPVYAAFHYSHPPVVERVKRLQEDARQRQGAAHA